MRNYMHVGYSNRCLGGPVIILDIGGALYGSFKMPPLFTGRRLACGVAETPACGGIPLPIRRRRKVEITFLFSVRFTTFINTISQKFVDWICYFDNYTMAVSMSQQRLESVIGHLQPPQRPAGTGKLLQKNPDDIVRQVCFSPESWIF